MSDTTTPAELARELRWWLEAWEVQLDAKRMGDLSVTETAIVHFLRKHFVAAALSRLSQVEQDLEELRERDCRPSEEAAKAMTVRLYKIPTATDEHSATVMEASNMLLVQSRDCKQVEKERDASDAVIADDHGSELDGCDHTSEYERWLREAIERHKRSRQKAERT